MIGRRELLTAAITSGLIGPARIAMAQPVGTVITNTFELSEGRVLLSAMIGASGPHRFALDTGGQLGIIDRQIAEKLKLKRVASRTLSSVGGQHNEPWYLMENMSFANGRLPPLIFIGLERGLGRERNVVGSVGAALFTSNDTDLDFGKNELRIHGSARPLSAGWSRLKSRFILGGMFPPLVAVEVDIDGFRVELVADTGASGNITLDAAASRASGLWTNDRPYAPTAVRGIGTNLARRRVVRPNKLKIGAFEFDRPLVALSPPDTGEDYKYTGMVGLGILSQMNLATDVKSGSLWAQANGLNDRSRVNYNLSGLWLTERQGNVVVEDVGTGSPAQAAGVVIGDRVVGLSLTNAIAAVTGGPGRRAVLNLERGGVSRNVNFVLAEYL